MTYRLSLTMLLLTSLSVSALEIPADKAVIELTPKFGPVTFSHLEHSRMEGVTCATCHHTLAQGETEGVQSCHSCHALGQFKVAEITKVEPSAAETSPTGAPKAKEAFHTLCRGCHERLAEQDKPTGPDDSCRDCHD